MDAQYSVVGVGFEGHANLNVAALVALAGPFRFSLILAVRLSR